MRRKIAGLLAVFCMMFAACSDKKSVPHGILSIDEMYPIVWDMIEAEQYATMLAKDSAHHVDGKLEHLRLYEQVLQSHHISREKFQKSYDYYLGHPEVNQILYDSLVAQGNRYRTEAYAHPSTRPLTPTPPARTPPGPVPPAHTPPAAHPATTQPAATHVTPPPAVMKMPGGIPMIRPFIHPDTSHPKNDTSRTGKRS